MKKQNLALEGLPNWNLYEDGSLEERIDCKTTGRVIPASRKTKIIELSFNGKTYKINIPVLKRRYFYSELKNFSPQDVVNLRGRGFPKYSITRSGRVWSHFTERWLSDACRADRGYCNVHLTGEDNKIHTVDVHNLVATAFKPNPYNYTQINHKDADKGNNDASNLEWVDSYANMWHARKSGLIPMPVTEKEVRTACELIMLGKDSNADIAKICNTTPRVISEIRNGRSYSNIAEEYGIEKHPKKRSQRKKDRKRANLVGVRNNTPKVDKEYMV